MWDRVISTLSAGSIRRVRVWSKRSCPHCRNRPGPSVTRAAALVARTVPLKQYFSSGAQQILLPLFGAVLAVVLLGALNAASLLLAQGQSRRAEIAMRASLGASPARIAAQLLLESGWLTVCRHSGVAAVLTVADRFIERHPAIRPRLA